MLRRIATLCFRHRRLALVGWLALVIGLGAVANGVGDEFVEGFRNNNTEAAKASALLERTFPDRAGDTGELVVHSADGLIDESTGKARPEVEALIDETLARIDRRLDLVSGSTSPFVDEGARQISQDATTAYAEIQLTTRATELPEADARTALDIVERARRDVPAGVQLELGGRAFMIQEFGGTSELIGVAAAILILLVAFGSVLAMGLPIATAIFGIGAGFGLITLLSHLNVMPNFTIQLGAMLGLGVGIDYALFIVTRFRQALHAGMDPEHATVLALDTAGRAVLFAGATVVISLFGLFLMGVDFIAGLGMGAAATVLITMLASVTLVPALLGFVGHNIDRLRVPFLHREEHATRQSIWFRWSRVVQHRPWTSAAAGLGILVLIAIPFFGLRLGFSDAGNGPPTDTTRRAYDLLSDGFGPGFNGPLVVAARTPDGPESLDGLGEALADVPGVAAVSPVIAAPDERSALIQVIPTTAPQSRATERLIERIREDVIPPTAREANTEVLIGGITAAGVDVSEYLGARLPIFIGGVLGLSFLLLLMVFRSVLVPIKAVLMNLLSIGASYGVIVAIFQWGWFADAIGVQSTGPIEPFVPMMMFAIVFGLSMDYEVFLLSRIREEYDRSGDNALAVADGLAATARVITAAAAIMVMVFASFALGEDRVVKVFGIGFAAAIFLDATLVRVVLVPATMELLGKANWWFPRWLEWIPRLHVEPPADLEDELRAVVAGERVAVSTLGR